MKLCLLPVLALVLLVGVGTGTGDQLSSQHIERLKHQVEWQLKTRHLGWDGVPLTSRRPVGAPVGREDLLQTEDGDEDSEDGQEEPLEPVPAEAAWLAATALLERHEMEEDTDGQEQEKEEKKQQEQQDQQEKQEQKQEKQELNDPEEEMANTIKRLTGWRGPQLGADNMDAIEF